MNITKTLNTVSRFFLTIVLTVVAVEAFAHAGFKASVPQANSQVVSPPDLMLTFEKPVMLMGLTVTDVKGKPLDIGFKPAGKNQATHSYPLPKVGNGLYTVNWSAMGSDGHNIKGSFSFSVGAEAKPAPAINHETMKNHSMGMDHSGHTQ
jgi:copper resistance protein C